MSTGPRPNLKPVIKTGPHDVLAMEHERIVRCEGLNGAKCHISVRLLLDGSLHVHVFGRVRADISATEPER